MSLLPQVIAARHIELTPDAWQRNERRSRALAPTRSGGFVNR